MKEQAAVIGVGQTHHRAKLEQSVAELVRTACLNALEDAGLEWADIDAVVLGKTPDIFDGVILPELYLSDAIGAVGKPIIRISTAGSVGGHTAIQAAHLVEAGIHQKVLTVAYSKESEGDINWAVSGGGIPFFSPFVAGPGAYFALHIRSYIEASKAPPHIGDLAALNERHNGAKNPHAQVQRGDITIEEIEQAPMLWDPIRYSHTCPSSDGACAMVISDKSFAEQHNKPVAWIRGHAVRSEPATAPWRDHVNPIAGRQCAETTYKMAGIEDPKELDLAELYVPFAWHEPMWLENMLIADEHEGWKWIDEERTTLEGDMPLNPSGGVLCANPTGATGMIRFAEAAQQVRGMAGEHQVDGAKLALGHAQGGAASYIATWVVGANA
jgi:acetyl-CoA C-acetyltransferase